MIVQALRRIARKLAIPALFFSCVSVAGAQQYCPPTGIDGYGQPCVPTPTSAQEQQFQSGSPGLTYPTPTPGQGQGTFVVPPSISNRPRTGILPQPGTQQQQPGERFQQGPFGFARPPQERNEFQDLVLQSVGRDLPMFGYDLFRQSPSTFAPLDRVPVTPDYLIGPGDELLVRTWGGVEIDYRVVVERDGTISIPRVGTVNVAGLRYRDLQPHLRAQIGRAFKNFELTVSMGQLRSIQIFVVGQAAQPGAYTVSSLSTLVNALFASGGPSAKGSMRAIQLRRQDKVVSQFDVYDLLLRGDKSKDVQLMPGDVIHIPPIGPLIAVSGSVNKPAIYEIAAGTSLGAALELAGGLATTADGQKIMVERIIDRRTRAVEEFSLDKAGLAHAVRDGDLVQVHRLSPRFSNAVTIRGNVAAPARHPWRAGVRVRDLVPDKEALIVPDYWVKRNLIIRPDVTGRTDFGLRMDLAYDLRHGAAVQEARRLANDPRTLEQQRQAQLVADPSRVSQDGQRLPPDGSRQPQQQQQQFQFQQLQQPGFQQPQLPDFQFGQQPPRNEVRQPLPEVNWDYAVIERLNRDDLTTRLIPFNLGRAVLHGDPQHNLSLEPGDVITIFSKDDIEVPVAKQTMFVRLEGEIATPGVYQVQPGETLRQLVTRVGGFSPNAYVFGATFTRESTRVMQQKRLDEMVDKLEQEVHRNAGSSSLNVEDAEQKKAAATSQIALVSKLRQLRATGRIVLRSPAPATDLKTLPDLVLEHGDVLKVPSRPSTVAVLGTVYNENAYIYSNDMRVSEYIAQAGGPTKDADNDSLYVVRADGTVLSKRQSGFGFFGTINSFGGERALPGDAIIVPEKLDKYRFTRELKDWSQIFYQFALGVAGLKVLNDL